MPDKEPSNKHVERVLKRQEHARRLYPEDRRLLRSVAQQVRQAKDKYNLEWIKKAHKAGYGGGEDQYHSPFRASAVLSAWAYRRHLKRQKEMLARMRKADEEGSDYQP